MIFTKILSVIIDLYFMCKIYINSKSLGQWMILFELIIIGINKLKIDNI